MVCMFTVCWLFFNWSLQAKEKKEAEVAEKKNKEVTKAAAAAAKVAEKAAAERAVAERAAAERAAAERAAAERAAAERATEERAAAEKAAENGKPPAKRGRGGRKSAAVTQSDYRSIAPSQTTFNIEPSRVQTTPIKARKSPICVWKRIAYRANRRNESRFKKSFSFRTAPNVEMLCGSPAPKFLTMYRVLKMFIPVYIIETIIVLSLVFSIHDVDPRVDWMSMSKHSIKVGTQMSLVKIADFF